VSSGIVSGVISNVELQETVKALRAKTGWTQEDLAREIGVSLSTVQRWESKGANPTRLARKELKKLFKKAGIGEP